MKDRLLKFLSENSLTATRFADEIGVQRSSISHILSGRNKPSFDFINKTLEKYSELNAEWLITGKGEMYKQDIPIKNTRYVEPDLFSHNTAQNTVIKDIPVLDHKETADEEKSEKQSDMKHGIPEKQDTVPGKIQHIEHQVKKVIIFYTDGSFEEYNPAGKI